MTKVYGDAKVEDRGVLSEIDVLNTDQLAPVEMGRADRETKGGFWGVNDCHCGFFGLG